MKNRKTGFTLIELLIVVAIIAILAAIAVPNFMEAQVRSKVARAKSDLRSLATAMEAYRIDSNVYPNSGGMGAGGGLIFPSLTGPGGEPIPGTPLTYDFAVRAAEGGDEWNEWLFTWSLSFYTAHQPNSSAQGAYPNLTTPISYITSFPADAFGFVDGAPFSYYRSHNSSSWIIYSTGPKQSLGLGSSIHQTYIKTNSDPMNYDSEDPYLILDPGGSNPNQQLITGRSHQQDDQWHGAHTYDPTNGTRSTGSIWRVGP